MKLKLFPATIGSQKPFHILFDKHLDHMLVKFEQNRRFKTEQNFELLLPQKDFLDNGFEKSLTSF